MTSGSYRTPRRASDAPHAIRGKTVAVVSGKGGSGKTMIAVALAEGAALAGRNAVLVDADFATGGLTYYLTFREFANARIGLSDLLGSSARDKPLTEWAASGRPAESDRYWLSSVRLVPIGDQRRIPDEMTDEIIWPLRGILDEASQLGDIVIVDCRGGIDKQSLAVCAMVDEILIVVETDTTSIQSSQHLSEIISNAKLKDKVAGFLLNKVMDDPTSLAKTASSLLRVDYLGAIPFDIEATRSYIQGKIPGPSTLFSRHVFAALPRLMPGVDHYYGTRVLAPEEFGTVTLRSPEVRFGGMAVFMTSMYLSITYVWLSQFSGIAIKAEDSHILNIATIVAMNVLVLGALSDSLKQVLGRIIRTYNSTAKYIARRIVRS